MTEDIINDDWRELKTYEVGYLLSPLVPEDQLVSLVSQIFEENVKASGGAVTSQLAPRLIRLAYPVAKVISNKRSIYKDGYFGAMRFQTYPDQLAKIKEALDKKDELIRYLFLAIGKNADKLLGSKPIVRRRPPTAETPASPEVKEVKEVKPEMSAEELDKEIEGLLVN